MQRRAVQIWEAETDLSVDGDAALAAKLAGLAWRLWARKGRSWMGALARLARSAQEEARLYGTSPQQIVMKRGFRLRRPKPTGLVRLYSRPRQPVTPEALVGYGFRPSALGREDGSSSTETPNSE